MSTPRCCAHDDFVRPDILTVCSPPSKRVSAHVRRQGPLTDGGLIGTPDVVVDELFRILGSEVTVNMYQ